MFNISKLFIVSKPSSLLSRWTVGGGRGVGGEGWGGEGWGTGGGNCGGGKLVQN